MTSIGDRLRRAYPSLSRNQRALAEYITERTEDAAFLTAVELGQRVGVSESTVVRFAYAIGLDGYPQLQRAIREQVKQRLSTVERMRAGRRDVQGSGDGLEAVWANDAANIQRTYENLSREDYDAAVALLAEARRVYVIGLRTSAGVAMLLTTALHYVGREAHHVDMGHGDFWERLDMAGPEDVVVGISVPRYTRWTTEMLRYVRGRGLRTVVLTDSPMSPLAEYADVTLPAATDFNAFIESFAAPLSLVNALVLGVALHDEERTLEALRRREQLWRERRLYDRPDRPYRGDAVGEQDSKDRWLMPMTEDN